MTQIKDIVWRYSDCSENPRNLLRKDQFRTVRKESARPFRKISLFGRLQHILQVFEDGGTGYVRIAAMGRGRSELHGAGAYKASHTADRR